MDLKYQLKDVNDGYLYSIIDNQTLNYSLKEIIKQDTLIKGESILNIPFNDKILINHNIFRIENENVYNINDGIIDIYLKQNSKLIYIDSAEISNGEIKKSIDNEFAIGTYNLILIYKGSRAYNETSFPIILNVVKGDIEIDFLESPYFGKPNETVSIPIHIKDNLNKGIENLSFSCFIDDKEYIFETDKNGSIIINITVPPIKNNECEDYYIYKVFFYFNHKLYNEPKINFTEIVINKLETSINLSSINSKNNLLYIDGSVISKDYDKIENVLYGDIDIYVLNSYIENFNIKEDGKFNFTINYNSILSELTNNIEVGSVNKEGIQKINTITKINIDEDIELKKNFQIKCEVISKSTSLTKSIPVNEGMVKFYILNKNREIIQTYISETDNNGICYGFFNITKSDTYIFVAQYYGFFEYKTSLSNEIEKVI